MSQRGRVAAFVFAALALGAIAGFLAGSHTRTTEHTCPAQGACPEPFSATRFHPTATIVVGAVTAIVVLALLTALQRASRHGSAFLEWD
jgi:uncharacterized membrane protein YeaQ/YmgE (transglycosylase-associated protein family)